MKRFVFIMTLIVLLGVGVVTACAEQPESPQTSEEMRQEDRDIDTDRHPSNEQAHEGTWSNIMCPVYFNMKPKHRER